MLYASSFILCSFISYEIGGSYAHNTHKLKLILIHELVVMNVTKKIKNVVKVGR